MALCPTSPLQHFNLKVSSHKHKSITDLELALSKNPAQIMVMFPSNESINQDL